MPKLQGIPSYRYHKARNCAVVTIDGRCFYLGQFGSAESKARYAEKIAEWQRSKSASPAPAMSGTAYTVGMLALDYLAFARSYYVKGGVQTKQVDQVVTALKGLVAVYEELPIDQFGPLKLRNVQQLFIGRGYCRRYVNALTGDLKRAFKWAASEERIPASIPDALKYVPGLKRGRTTARESEPVGPVDDATVNETVKFLSPIVAAMVELQRLTGMRPGEVCAIRPCDVTFSVDGTGCFRPESHKTEHHGRERRIYLGPQAVAALRPFLDRDPEAYCFSPAESVAWHRAQHRAKRKTPVWKSHQERYDRKRRRTPQRAAGDRFTVCAYNRAIQRACESAFGMPPELRTVSHELTEAERDDLKRQARDWRRQNCWSANQLRHSVATRLRKAFGIEAAQVTLGHSNPKVTEIYAERDFEAARKIMAEVG